MKYDPNVNYLLPGVNVILRDEDGHHYHASAHGGAGMAFIDLFDIEEHEKYKIEGLEIPWEYEVVLNPLEPYNNHYDLVTLDNLRVLVTRRNDDFIYVRTDQDHKFTWRELITELDAIENRDFNAKVTPQVYWYVNEFLEICSATVHHQDLHDANSLINKHIKAGNFFPNSRDASKAIWSFMGFDKEEFLKP